MYQKVAIVTKIKEESFFSSFKVLAEEGYLKVAKPGAKKKRRAGRGVEDDRDADAAFFQKIQTLKKGMSLEVSNLAIKRRKDVAAEALQFRVFDPCDGKCRAADRG